MGTANFRPGAVIEINGKEYSMLRKVEPMVWQLEETRTKRIHEYSTERLLILYVDGLLKFLGRDSSLKESQSYKVKKIDFTSEQWEKAKMRRAYVMAVLDLPNSHSRMRPIIQDTCEKLGTHGKAPDSVTVLRWKNKYLQAGKDITALIDLTERKGNRKSRYPNEVEEISRQAIQDVYLKEERGSIQATLERAQGYVSRENRLRLSSMQLPRPTNRLIKRLIEEMPAFDRYVARYGIDAANKKFRTVLGHHLRV